VTFGVCLTSKWKFPHHLRVAVGFHHNPEHLSVEVRHLATLIQTADVLCCEEKIGFYLTAQHDTVSEQMLDALAITREQVEEVRASLDDQIAEAETTLTS